MYDDSTQGWREVEKAIISPRILTKAGKWDCFPPRRIIMMQIPLASFPVTCLSFPSLLPSPDLVPKGGSPNVPTPAWLLLPGLGKRSENVSDSSKQVLHGKSSLPIISQTCYSPVFFHLDPKPGPWEAL